MQPELPVWITSSGNVETFRLAGTMGANLLTHLLGQSLRDLGAKIAEYRRCLAASTGAAGGRRGLVTLMLHAFLGDEFDPERLTSEEVDFLVTRAFERYFETSGLFGTVETSLRMTERLHAVGVDEVACLIDFGVDFEPVMASLERLDELRRRVTAAPAPPAPPARGTARPSPGR